MVKGELRSHQGISLPSVLQSLQVPPQVMTHPVILSKVGESMGGGVGEWI